MKNSNGQLVWNANGKIKSIQRELTSTKSDLEFVHDASGNRIIKIVKPRDGTGILSQLHWTYTYYVRDASGNVMAVYERSFAPAISEGEYEDRWKVAELHIYGSKRVGLLNADSLITLTFADVVFTDNYENTFSGTYDAITPVTPCTANCKVNYRRELGNKQYEVSNHLGNVLATVSDRKLSEDNYSYTSSGSGNYNYDAIRNTYFAVTSGTGTHNRVTFSSDNRTDWYTADVVSYSDYYAFGAQMDARYGGQHRYTFNGKETDVESDLQDYGLRIYNARLGKFLSVDPLAAEYAWNSTYAFAEGDVIRSIDLDGAEKLINNMKPIGKGTQIQKATANTATATSAVAAFDKGNKVDVPTSAMETSSAQSPGLSSVQVFNDAFHTGQSILVNQMTTDPVTTVLDGIWLNMDIFMTTAISAFSFDNGGHNYQLPKYGIKAVMFFHTAGPAEWGGIAGPLVLSAGAGIYTAQMPTTGYFPRFGNREGALTAEVNANKSGVTLPSSIHMGAQGKHIVGHNNYNPILGKSILDANPQSLLDGVNSGKYSILRSNQNNVIVDFGENIGTFFQNGKAVGSTRYGTIHYGNKGAHIVPANPIQY